MKQTYKIIVKHETRTAITGRWLLHCQHPIDRGEHSTLAHSPAEAIGAAGKHAANYHPGDPADIVVEQ